MKRKDSLKQSIDTKTTPIEKKSLCKSLQGKKRHTNEQMTRKQRCHDPAYLKMRKAYCAFIKQSFKFFAANIAYAYHVRESNGRKKAIILDADGVFLGEGCLVDVYFQCAIDFVKSHHSLYGSALPIFIITARTSKTELVEDLTTKGLTIGPGKQIERVYYDCKKRGTFVSKTQNRQSVRDLGYQILATCGDNLTDLVSEDETGGYADTVNVLLPNYERHVSRP